MISEGLTGLSKTVVCFRPDVLIPDCIRPDVLRPDDRMFKTGCSNTGCLIPDFRVPYVIRPGF